MPILSACKFLQVIPQRCLYIGDGNSNESTGARQVGMDAMLLCMPHEREMVMQREEARQWGGPVIERIGQVVDYLDDMGIALT